MIPHRRKELLSLMKAQVHSVFLRLAAVLAALVLLPAAAFTEQAPASPAADLYLYGARVFTQQGRVTLADGPCTDAPVRSAEEAASVVEALIPQLGGDERTQLVPLRTLTDPSGNRYYVFRQVCADTVVQGGAVKLVTDARGNMLGLTASLIPVSADAEPAESVTAAEAEQAVLLHERQAGRPDPELLENMTGRVILPVNREPDIESEEEDTGRYVWAVYTANPDNTDRPYLAHYVSMDGEYLYSLPTVYPRDRAGSSGYDAAYLFDRMEPAEYTGYVDLSDGTEKKITVTLMRDTETGVYYLGNIERRIAVADCWEFLYNHGSVVLESSPDNLEWDQTALLSLYHYCLACDFYRAIGWNGGDGEGAPMLILKDFCDRDHRPINNAAYAGSFYGYECFLASSANDFSQCLDVLAHEYTHCVTESLMTYNAYMNDQGAINEALSDIQGNLCEMLAGATEDSSWLLGENSRDTCRSMSDPHRYRQPAFTWDLYYAASVGTPTSANDRGGVHANSSLLSRIAYLLCGEGGMSLEQARSFWFSVGCAMVPGSDYPQLRELLPWVMRITGNRTYLASLTKAMDAVCLGRDALPETFAEDRARITLTLPDVPGFTDGNWLLSVVSLNTEELENRMRQLSELISREDPSLPAALRGLAQEAESAGDSDPSGSLIVTLLDAVMDMAEPKEPGAAAPDLTDPEQEEFLAFLKKYFSGLAFSGSGSAGADGRTVRMTALPGRALPVLTHLVLKPNSDQLEQLNLAVWFRDRWVDLTPLLETLFTPLDGDASLRSAGTVLEKLTDTGIPLDLLELAFSCRGAEDWLNALTLEVRPGETCPVPDTGLSAAVDFSANLAGFLNSRPDPEIAPRMSRPARDGVRQEDRE